MSITQGVYLGTHGGIMLQRTNSGMATFAELDPVDINTNAKRFSFLGAEQVITGDKIEIRKLVVSSDPSSDYDKSANITLVDGVTPQPSIERFAFKDVIGGLRLYNSYADAINGDIDQALDLKKLSKKQKIRVKVDPDSNWNGLAKIVDWSFTSNRQALDLTTLGDQFVQQYEAGLISGQGTCTAIWDDAQRFCDDDTGSPLDNNGAGHPSDGKPRMPVTENDAVANYLVQLAIRVSIGAKFKGRFYIKYGGSRQTPDPNQLAVFWEADCICTNVSMTFQADNIVMTRIAFVTEGNFRLRMQDDYAFNSFGSGRNLVRDADNPALTTEDGRELVGRD